MKEILLTIIALCCMTRCDAKQLIAYFSGTGTTQGVAEEIQRLTGADIYRIQPSDPYSSNPYNDSDRIQNEAYNNLRPGVANLPDNLDGYDVIFIGSPIWWHYPAMVVCTFLENYDLSGKTIIPFFTYAATTYFQQAVNKILEVTPNSTHLTAFGSTGSIHNVESWLKEIGQLGESTGIENISTNDDNAFSISVSGNSINVNIVGENPVDVYTMTGTFVESISGIGNHSLSLPTRTVYLFTTKDVNTGKRITKKISLR